MLISSSKSLFTQTRLFKRGAEHSTAWSIIKWWELRRIPFNIIVGLTGVFAGAICVIAALLSEKITGQEAPFPDPPLFIFAAIILYGVMANICFTGGWVTELLARRIWAERAEAYGEISFSFGTLFSVLLTSLPAVVYTAIIAVHDVLHLLRHK